MELFKFFICEYYNVSKNEFQDNQNIFFFLLSKIVIMNQYNHRNYHKIIMITIES